MSRANEKNRSARGRWTRRRFMEIVGIAGGAVALRTGFQPAAAFAAPANGQLFLSVYFSGGWDQLALFDPRPNNTFTSATVGTTRILPGYDRIQDAQVAAILAANPTGIRKPGVAGFGPGVPESFLAHHPDLCVLRGVSMDTLTHEVGRRYFLTGKFPRGLAANGSSMNTAVAAQGTRSFDMPNLSIRSESYNENMAAHSTAIRADTANDIRAVLRPLGPALTSNTESALRTFETGARCDPHPFDANGQVTSYRLSQDLARVMVASNKYSLFDFNLDSPPADVAPLFSAMQIATTADLAGAKGRAAIAGQALAKGVSQAVALELVSGIDDHFDWDTVHIPAVRDGLNALGLLISYLKATAAPAGLTGTVWDNTTLVVFSEFARTPLINGRDGRDHHLASSAVVAGPGIRGNQVIGQTTDVGMAARKLNFTTGVSNDTGAPLRPADVQATLLHSMGLSYEHISNQSPQLIQTMLKP